MHEVSATNLRILLSYEDFHEAYKNALKYSNGSNFEELKKSSRTFFQSMKDIITISLISSTAQLTVALPVRMFEWPYLQMRFAKLNDLIGVIDQGSSKIQYQSRRENTNNFSSFRLSL